MRGGPLPMAERTRSRADSRSPFRIGVFGKCGAGNIGNDACLEALLIDLGSRHPEAHVDAMCAGPETVRERYGIGAIPLQWGDRRKRPASRMAAIGSELQGLVVDTVRIASWACRHDALIIPGTGVLEASLPLLPRAFPYSMLVLFVAGRLSGAKVALVDVGAGSVNQRSVRWIQDQVVRLATYRSFRDAHARDALRRRGHRVDRDRVYPDLAFSLPIPRSGPGDPRTVGVGVMDYRGTNDDRKRGDSVYAAYAAEMKRFVKMLVDDGRSVRLLIGDANGSDDAVAREILDDVRTSRPELDRSRVVAETIATFTDLARAMSDVGSVVAIRYHNVLCALKMAKPTIAVGYSPKHRQLMSDMGVAEFCHDVSTLDADRLAEQLTELERRSEELRTTLLESNAHASLLVQEQFEALSMAIFPDSPGSRPGESSSAEAVPPAPRTAELDPTTSTPEGIRTGA